MLFEKYFARKGAAQRVEPIPIPEPEPKPVLSAPELSEEELQDIERDVARKIQRLMPDLGDAASAELREQAFDVLESLANDQLPRIRQLVAEAIKDSAKVPHAMVRTLAEDVELVVSAPILEYSPLLSDEDLKEVIAKSQTEGALDAIARREGLSEDVSEDIAATMDISAVAALLANESAVIREATLEKIVDGAKCVDEWHEPLVFRPELSKRAMQRIAGFVASSLVHVMVSNHKLEADFADMLLDMVRARLDHDPDDEAAAEKAKKLLEWGCVDDAYLGDLIDHRRTRVVIHLLAALAEIQLAVADRIIDALSPKGVIALVWKAGFSMRTALRVQYDVAHISSKNVVNAKDGVDYPLTEGELTWQLSYFTNA